MAMVYSHRPKLCDSYHDYDPYNLVKEPSATQMSESQQYLYSQEFNSEQSINGYDQKPGSLHVSDAQPVYDHHQTNVYQNSDSYQSNYEQITDLNYNYGQRLEIKSGQHQSNSHFTEYSPNPTLSKVSNSQGYNHDSNREETTYDNPKPSLEDLAPALLKALEQYRNTIPRIRRNQLSHSHQDITKDVSERFTAPNQSHSLTRSSHHSSQNQLDQHQAFDVQQMWTKALDHAYPFRKRLSSSAIHMPTLYQMTTNSNTVNPNAFGGDQIWSKTNPQRKKKLDRQQVYNSSSSSQLNFNTSPNGSSYDFFDASSTQQKHFDKQKTLNQPIQVAGKQNSVRINGSSFQNYDPYNLQGKLLVPKKYDPYNLDSGQQTTTTSTSTTTTTAAAALPFQNDHSYEEMNDYSDDDDDMYDEEERQQLLWEQEMYQQMKYKSPRRFFHTFEADHCQAGINFADEEESKRFEQVIGDKITERQRKKEERRRQQNANRTQHVNMTRGDIGLNKISAAPPPPECNFISNTVSPMPKKFTTKKDKKNKSKLTKDDIGLPTDFRHVGHVGWDPQKGLDMDKVDEDMKKLFESVGYTSGDNIDKETVDFIYDFVEKYGGIDAVKKEMANRERNVTSRPTVPPPTPSRIGQPPLPPGRHMSPAPPPPSRAPPPSRGPAIPPPPPMRSTLPPPPKVPGAPPPPPPTNPPNSAHLPPRVTTVESGGGAPPAPPPPPPPPPPPVMSDDKDDSAATQGTGTDARSALLDQIHRGTQLKKVTVTENRPPVEDKRDNLLSEIRNVGQKNLKKVDASQSARPTSTGEDGIVGALAQALANRMKSMQGSDGESDEESSDDDNTDDDDWDD